MSNPAVRARVERMLKGDYRVEDLTRIFLWMRTRSYGRQTVREVGDFVAHADERTKGIGTDATRDFFAALRHSVPNLGKSNNLSDFPPSFRDAIVANFRLLDPEIVRRDTGLGKRAAALALASFLRDLHQLPSGNLSATKITSHEFKLVECLSQYIVSKPAFTDVGLFADLSTVLQKEQLLKPDEAAAFAKAMPFTSLFAMTSMHQCAIVLEDGQRSKLSLYYSSEGNTRRLGISAAAVLTASNGSDLTISGPFFGSSLEATEWCEAGLLQGAVHAEYGVLATSHKWDCPMELGTNGKLAML